MRQSLVAISARHGVPLDRSLLLWVGRLAPWGGRLGIALTLNLPKRLPLGRTLGYTVTMLTSTAYSSRSLEARKSLSRMTYESSSRF